MRKGFFLSIMNYKGKEGQWKDCSDRVDLINEAPAGLLPLLIIDHDNP